MRTKIGTSSFMQPPPLEVLLIANGDDDLALVARTDVEHQIHQLVVKWL